MGRLRTEDGGQCCLGVACEVGEELGILPHIRYDDSLHEWGYDTVSESGLYHFEYEVLPYPLWSAIGLTSENPDFVMSLDLAYKAEMEPDYTDEDGTDHSYTDYPRSEAATEWNDEYEASFPVIADMLEEFGCE